MRLSNVAILVLAAGAEALGLADVAEYANDALLAIKRSMPATIVRKDGGGVSCPPVWTNIATVLKSMYLGSDGQCNDDARAAIRLAFHDCGPWDASQGPTGGCDGSLVNTIGLTTSTNGVPDRELSRPENAFLTDIANKMIKVQKSFPSVTMADLVTFGSAVAIVTCPGGPQIQTFVGRKDSRTPAKSGGLPDVHADAESLYKLFQAKGFTAKDLAALLGAHSTSKGFGQSEMPSGTPQDSTPGLWDVKYYQDTLTPPSGVVPFASDPKLAVHPIVGKEFQGFIGRQGKWNGDFSFAMTKLTLLGVPGGTNNLIDCTNAVPRATSNKRDMRAAPINDRVR